MRLASSTAQRRSEERGGPWETTPVDARSVLTQRTRIAPTMRVQFGPPPTIWLLDEPECKAYERFVHDHAGASFYHSLVWRNVLLQAGLGEPMYLLAMQGDDVAGVLPMFETCDGNGMRRLVSLPDTPVAGVVSDDAPVRWLLASRAVALAGLRGTAGAFARTFQPLASQRVRTPGTAWLRIPTPAACSWLADVDDQSAGNIRLSPLRAAAWERYPANGLGWLTTLAECCANTDYHPAQALATDGRTGVQTGAVCLLTGRNAHVLSWTHGADTRARARLLRYLANMAINHGVSHVDFPAPPALLHLVLQTPLRETADIAVEQPCAFA